MAVRTRLMINLMAATFFILATTPNCFPVILGDVSNEFKLTAEESGRVVMVNFIGILLGVPVTGYLSPKLGAKSLMMAGCAMQVVGLLTQAFSMNYIMFCVAMFFLGISGAILDVLGSPVATALGPESRASTLNFVHSFFCVGAVSTSFITTSLLSFGVSWRTLTFVFIPTPIALFVMFLLNEFPPLVEGGDGQEEPLIDILKSPTFWLAICCICMAGAVEVGAMTWAPTYASRVLGFNSFASGLLLVTMMIAMTIGRLLASKFGGNIESCHFISLSGVMCTCFIILVAVITQPHIAYGCCIFIGLGIAWAWPTILATANDTHPNAGAPMFALFSLVGAAGSSFMPWVIGIVTDATSSLRIGFSMLVFGAILQILFAQLLRLFVLRGSSKSKSHEVPGIELGHSRLE
eukprot:PhF_6_TR8070/c0_g1_i1/m.12490